MTTARVFGCLILTTTEAFLAGLIFGECHARRVLGQTTGQTGPEASTCQEGHAQRCLQEKAADSSW